MLKSSKLFALTLLTSLLLLSALSCAVRAQGDATVVVLDSVGGTIDPTGVTTYADGTVVTLTAMPTDETFVFINWIISDESGSNTVSDNPLKLTVAGGVTYAVQAVFQPVEPVPGQPLPSDLSNAAIVVVLASGGGTTSPAPGRYALASAQALMLSATANSGWQFSHWIISGSSTDHGGAPVNLTPTDNPYNVNHGYGYTYNYQAVFTPVGSTVSTPTPSSGGTIGGMSMETWIIIALAVVIVVLLVTLVMFAMKSKK